LQATRRSLLFNLSDSGLLLNLGASFHARGRWSQARAVYARCARTLSGEALGGREAETLRANLRRLDRAVLRRRAKL